jgi:hypothetical protein
MLSGRLTGALAILALVVVLAVEGSVLAQMPAPINPQVQVPQAIELRLLEAKNFFEMGYLDDCAGEWKALMAMSPPGPVCLELRNKYGFELFVRMLDESKLTDAVKEFLKRAREEEERLRRDPAYIGFLVQDVQRTPTDRQTAMYELKQVGERAVPALLARLAGAADEKERLNVVLALDYMGTRAVAPLLPALQAKSADVRGQVILLLGKARDQRALGPLKCVLGDEKQPDALRRSARWALNSILKGAGEHSAAEYYFRLGQLYYYQSPDVQPGYFEEKVPLWKWDADKQTIVSVEVSRGDFWIERCKECCYEGLASAPDDVNLRELLVSIYFVEKEAKGAQADPQLTERINLLVSSGGKPVLLAALRRQLQDDKPKLAAAVIDVLRPVLASTGLTGKERTVAGNSLLDALEFPDQLLDFFAAEAVADASPTEVFQAQDAVMPVLTWALLWGADVKTALAISPDRTLLNAFVGHLRALGFKVRDASSLAEAVEVSRGLPTPTVVLADAAVMAELRPALLEDFRTRFVVRVTVAAAAAPVSAPEGQAEVTVPADITEARLGEVLKKLLETSGAHTRLTVDKVVIAQRAAEALAKVSRGATVLNVAPASGALLLAAGYERKEVQLPVLEALGNSRDANALGPLLALAGDAAKDAEVRLGALKAARVVLGAMAKADKKVYDELVALLDDKSETIRQAAAACLSSGPFSAEQIVAVLVEKKVIKQAE